MSELPDVRIYPTLPYTKSDSYTVLKNLAEVECDDTFFFEFLNQVNNGEFPLQNISYLFWMEVVKWFGCKNTCRMRYSEATKKFWKLGLKVFKEVHPFYESVSIFCIT